MYLYSANSIWTVDKVIEYYVEDGVRMATVIAEGWPRDVRVADLYAGDTR